MAEQSNALTVSERQQKFCTALRQRAPAIMRAAPKGVDGMRLLGMVENSVAKNPTLLNCKAGTVFQSVADSMTKSWEIGEHAYLVPFKDTCTLLPSWRGMLDLVFRTGELLAPPKVTYVYAGESFNVKMVDGDETYEHDYQTSNPNRIAGDETQILYVYCVAHLKTGAKVRHYLSADQIDIHKQKYSKAWSKSDSPWTTNWAAMASKTVILQMIRRGMLPVSVEDKRYVRQEDAIEKGEPITLESSQWAALDEAGEPVVESKPEPKLDPPKEQPAELSEADAKYLAEMVHEIDLAQTVGDLTTLYKMVETKRPAILGQVKALCGSKRKLLESV